MTLKMISKYRQTAFKNTCGQNNIRNDTKGTTLIDQWQMITTGDSCSQSYLGEMDPDFGGKELFSYFRIDH